MATPTTAQINAEIGNATRELSPPSACFKYHAPADGYDCLEWMDEPSLQPTKVAVMAKAKELATALLG